MEMAQKARLGGLIYLTGVLATIYCTPFLSLGHFPESLFAIGFCLLLLWRETAFRLVSRGRDSALKYFWVYQSCFFVMAIAWIAFVLYVLSVAEKLEGVPALALVATAGFTAGTIVVLVPHIRMIRWFLAIILLLPSPFLPYLIQGTEAWFLIVVDTLAFFFLYDIARKQTLAYWQRVELAEEFQHQAEELRSSEEKARMASRAKSDFLAKMSHEIRTPMNGVIGMVQLLDEATTDPRQKEYIEIIRSSGKALLSIINDILDFSKLEAGKVILHPSPVDLAELLGNARSIFMSQANEKNLQIELEVSSANEGRWVMVDALRFQQILFNLVGNAIKFTDAGKISLVLNYSAVEGDHCTVELMVSDTGAGIDVDLQQRIFEQFEQADEHRNIAGTGLGLSICKRLVELMAGEISVRSEPGHGSTFTVSFPATLIAAQKREAEKTRELSGQLTSPASLREKIQQLQVLVVEDNLVNQQVIRHLLQHIGCGVEVTDDGFEALELINARHFDIILMDCDMPRIDGYETTRRLRQREQQQDIPRVPIIALTAHVVESVRQKCFDAGMDDFLIKPVKLPLLEKTLLHHGGLLSPDD